MKETGFKKATMFLSIVLLSYFLALYYTRLHNIDLAYNFKNKKGSCELMIELGERDVECIEYCDRFSTTEDCIPFRDLYILSWGALLYFVPFGIMLFSLLIGFVLGVMK